MSVTEENIELGVERDCVCGDNILTDMSDMIKDQEETTVKNKEVLDSDMGLEEITVATTKHLKPKVGSYVVVQYEGELFPGIVEVLDVKGAVVYVMIKYGKYWK
ncbi:hypothetical protein LOD99_11005 [Oopsacas minuta]|uniref:Uncharacterized protein n=1 Tax=Oopsacas minuta TaxID=111878 RepID=A0AAV7KD85_9METZ|nr:hypothetical protein LOD99_11005 [Oopsacas minuta]